MSNKRETTQAWVYPTQRQHEQWKAEADERNVSLSQFVQDMVEAGRKKFTAEVEYDELQADLRAQRNDLKSELDHARNRIASLEAELHRSEREAVGAFIEQHPEGVTFEEIGQHIINTVPERVNRHLEDLEGERVRHDPGVERFYPAATKGGETTDEGIGSRGTSSE